MAREVVEALPDVDDAVAEGVVNSVLHGGDSSAEDEAFIEGECADASTIGEIVAEQDREAQQGAVAFLKGVLRLRGVRVEREGFLRQELRKLGVSNETIDTAVATTPVRAGVGLAQLDELA